MFHKTLKSGCRAEDARLRAAERLVNLIAVFCIVSWCLFWTMINRIAPDSSPELVLTRPEISALDQLQARRQKPPPDRRSLSSYLTQIARLGGYLDRANDPPPGNIVIWRGWSRLIDIVLGTEIARPYG